MGPEVHFEKWVQKYTCNEVGTEVHFQKCASNKGGYRSTEVHYLKCTLKVHLSEVYFVEKYTSLPKPKYTSLPKTSEVGGIWVYVGCCCYSRPNPGNNAIELNLVNR